MTYKRTKSMFGRIPGAGKPFAVKQQSQHIRKPIISVLVLPRLLSEAIVSFAKRFNSEPKTGGALCITSPNPHQTRILS